LGLVDQAQIGRDEPIIDVGAGRSTLVDHLLARGYRDLTVRYTHEELAREFPRYELDATAGEDHVTPWAYNPPP
jgi:16S rRNA A1518/A1519 N6-dimethyltransferase RsmA/KsgA/DIM1 with predicted DNA glycosylase/AP lyase activity